MVEGEINMEFNTLVALITAHNIDIETAENIAQDILCFCSDADYDDFGE